ncbi:RagB/SusD family nutrient uptake outer membrane protein [Sphingobacterium sp. LRF_L2]|uniref:RagB/SusD family nutrient uptake outer membrane protein n=1 Tax=Sphingobacterium sp. LRF_L2 TaxID=3369421 RepID=UPI003F5E3B9B
MKLDYKIFNLLLLAFFAVSCSKVLDKTDLSTLDGELIYSDSTLAFLNLSYIYNDNLPSWFGNTGGSISGAGSYSEESTGSSIYFLGTVTSASVTDFGTGLSTSNNWAKIRKINEFIRDIDAGTLPTYTKNKMKGEALFFRAYRYFDLIRLYGGVPLVLSPQNPIGEENREEILLARNSTTECIKQIVADLDSAIAWTPGKWSATTDWGRITRGAAAAFKGRVLLTYASPQFNPDDLEERWQAAYDANLQAKTLLTAAGFGLNSSYQNMWFTEANNVEAILVTGYNTSTTDQYKKNNSYDNQTRPAYLGTSGGSNQPSWELVQAYPMKDGKKISDENGGYAYDEQLFYKNRDPRFDATIAYNGCTWPILGNTSYRLWTYQALTSGAYKSVESSATNTGFYCRKAIDPSISESNVAYSGTDWMEIRYAEVLLNLAESACGINRLSSSQEGYQGIIDVRKRAGIEAGSDALYGLYKGMSRDQLFEAILFERQIEFAFEGKRFWDLRRWKKIESTLNGTKRHGIVIKLSSSTDASTFASTRDAQNLDDLYANYFTIETVEKDSETINWKSEYYFFAIPPAAITNNPNLLQNNTWDGAFNPLL